MHKKTPLSSGIHANVLQELSLFSLFKVPFPTEYSISYLSTLSVNIRRASTCQFTHGCVWINFQIFKSVVSAVQKGRFQGFQLFWINKVR
jgi:hypothetical protein